MKVQFSLVGHLGAEDDIVVDLPAVPSVGDVIQWRRLSQAATVVRTVVWYVTHDDDDAELDEPFAYIVVGPAREPEHGLQSMHSRPSTTSR